MAKVTFQAKAGLPHDKGGKRFLYKKGGRKYDKSGGYRLVQPVYFNDKETLEVEDWEATVLTTHFPDCFTVKAAKKPKNQDSPAESEA